MKQAPTYEERHHRVRAGRHSLFVREYGNPDGQPVLILHGGPGSGSDPSKAKLFDLDRCRVVLADQRGAGQSVPRASTATVGEELDDNTMRGLVSDIPLIKSQLGVTEPWLVAGASFGAALGLSYALTNQREVSGLLLWSVFLGRSKDIEFMFGPAGYAASRRPHAYETFLDLVPADRRHDPVAWYSEMMWSPNIEARNNAAWQWEVWNRQLYYANEHGQPARTAAEVLTALDRARLFQHYARNGMFFSELFGPSEGSNQLLENTSALDDLPMQLVHGELDAATPVEGAHALQKALNARPDCRTTPLHIVPGASHSTSEPGFTEQLRLAAASVLAGD